MKRYVLLLIALMPALIALAACGDPSYTVSLVYDETKGIVEFVDENSVASADDEASEGAAKTFPEGETVTVKVSPKEGYVVDALTANDKPVALDENSSYAFIVKADTTIKAVFAEDEREPETPLSFPQAYRGTWKEVGGTETFVVNGYSLEISNEGGRIESKVSVAAGGGYAVEYGGKTYNLRAVEGGTFVLVLSSGAGTRYLLKDGPRDLEISPVCYGRYVSAEKELEIGETLLLGDEEGILVGAPAEGGYLVLFDELYSLTFGTNEAVLAPYGGSGVTLVRDTGTDLGVVFDPYWIGSWKEIGGEFVLSIARTSLSLNGVLPDEMSSSNGAYAFSAGGKEYSVSWYGLIGGVVLEMREEGGPTRYFAGSRHPLLGADEEIESVYYRGDEGDRFVWKKLYGTERLEISARAILYDYVEAEAVVPTGYIESFTDPLSGESVRVQANCYYFFADGEPHLLYWEPEMKTPVLDGMTFSDGVVHLPLSVQGTWKSLDGDVVLVADESSVKVGGFETELWEESGGFVIVYYAKEYYLEPYNGTVFLDGEEINPMIYLQERTEDLFEIGEKTFFLNEKLYGKEFSFAAVAYGSYRSEDDAKKFEIAASGALWGTDRVKVLSETHEAGAHSYSYLFSVGAGIYSAEYFGGIGLRLTDVATFATFVYLRETQIDKTAQGPVFGTYRGVYHAGIEQIVVVEADRIVYYSSDDGKENVFSVSDGTLVVAAQGETLLLEFTLKRTVGDDSGIGGYSSAPAPAAATETVVSVKVRIAIRTGEGGLEAAWCEWGTQDGVSDYYEQGTLSKSGLY